VLADDLDGGVDVVDGEGDAVHATEEMSGSPTVVSVVVTTVVSSRGEIAAVPALPSYPRSCADNRMSRG
jgi:hypothetical protein